MEACCNDHCSGKTDGRLSPGAKYLRRAEKAPDQQPIKNKEIGVG